MARDRKAPAAKAAEKSSSRRAPVADLTAHARALTGSCLARASRNLARRTTQVYDRHLAPHDFTLPQFAMLMMIAAAKDDTLGALATDAGLDPSTLTRNLQGLEKLGLVEIASIDEDQRRRAVWLTETGARRVSAAIPAWEAAQREIVETLGAKFTGDLMRASGAL
jgi:DNA-binding MarR family transcriptional regulator